MKYIKNWKIFESIKIESVPTIYQIHTHQTTFADKEFNPELLSDDFIEGVKYPLYELSDDCDIEISFKRTIPGFKKVVWLRKSEKQKPKREIGVTDLMVIGIRPQDTNWSERPRTQATKRNYINNKILEDTAYEIRSLVGEYDLEVAICQSYLPFSSIEDFFKYRSNTEHLTDVTIIVF